MEPQKPFACAIPDCGMAFTNEDHLHVHTKKHDMMLTLGAEQKAAFVVDQTPTPTSFIKNCEDVGLFQALQDLQNVNPFDEGFKRAIENNIKPGLVQAGGVGDDSLHTPQMYPAPPDPREPHPPAAPAALAALGASQSNVTISRSSSDESGSIKEYETTTISKLTNEVTTISRVIGKQDSDKTDDVASRHDATNTDLHGTVSYRNNVIKIHSNVEIRKESQNIETCKVGDVRATDAVYRLVDKPMFTQKSIDYVVDSFTSEAVKRADSIVDNDSVVKMLKDTKETKDDNNDRKRKNDDVKMNDDFEVILKFPNQKCVRMKAVEEVGDESKVKVKEKLKKVIEKKIEKPVAKPIVVDKLLAPQVYPMIMPYRVIFNNATPVVATPDKIPIKILKNKVAINTNDKVSKNTQIRKSRVKTVKEELKRHGVTDDHKSLLERRNAASKRYRNKLKTLMETQAAELEQLRTLNQRLDEENQRLRALLQAYTGGPDASMAAHKTHLL